MQAADTIVAAIVNVVNDQKERADILCGWNVRAIRIQTTLVSSWSEV